MLRTVYHSICFATLVAFLSVAPARSEPPEFDDAIPGAGVLKTIEVGGIPYTVTIYYNQTFDEAFAENEELDFANLRDAREALEAVSAALEAIPQEQLTATAGYYAGADLVYLPWNLSAGQVQALFLTETAIRGTIIRNPSSLTVRRDTARAGRSFLNFQKVEADPPTAQPDTNPANPPSAN
jgi:hypothetical protein